MQHVGSDDILSYPVHRTAEWGRRPVGLQSEGFLRGSPTCRKAVWPTDTRLVPSSEGWPVAMFLRTSMPRNPTHPRQRDGCHSTLGRMVEMKRHSQGR